MMPHRTGRGTLEAARKGMHVGGRHGPVLALLSPLPQLTTRIPISHRCHQEAPLWEEV